MENPENDQLFNNPTLIERINHTIGLAFDIFEKTICDKI